MHTYSFMGDFTAKTMSNLLSLVATLYFVAVTPAVADPHDGLTAVPDDIDISMDEGFGEDAPDPKQGSLVGKVPQAAKKPEDFLFKNRKDKEFPLEFLIPFMKVSQVFQKRIPAKEQAREQSAMQPKRAIASDETKRKTRPWAKEFNEKVAPVAASAGSEFWPDNLKEALSQIERKAQGAVKPNVIGARPAAQPSRNLIKSLKAD